MQYSDDEPDERNCGEWLFPENEGDLIWSKSKERLKYKKIYLEVPFKLKDDIKKLNGKWDSDCKKWFYYDNNDKKKEINDIIEKYNSVSNTGTKNKRQKLYIYLPFKMKDEIKSKYKGLYFEKDKKQWFIYDDNINKIEIINTYHKGNFDSLEINDNLITLDEYLKQLKN